jgi:hypothetical protein
MMRALVRAAGATIIRGVSRFERREIVLVYAWPDFARKMHAIADLLRARGLPTRVTFASRGWDAERIRASRNLHIGLWNTYPEDALPRHYIFYNAEPMRLERWRTESRLDLMRGAEEVWDYWTHNAPWIAPIGLTARVVPFGYSPYYEQLFRTHVGTLPDQDIDVLFYGSETPRRSVMLEQIAASGCRLHQVSERNPAYGADLTRLIARAKVVICPFSHDEPEAHTPDFARLDLLLSNRVCVLQERPPVRDDRYGFEEHVPTAPYEQFADHCRQLLADAGLRRAAADRSHEWFRSTLALERFVPLETLAGWV